jgi:hypothetical protein
MGSGNPWRAAHDRLTQCFYRIAEGVVGNSAGDHRGGSSDSRPYRFNAERFFFDETVVVIVNFEHEDDDQLRFLVRIVERKPPQRPLAVGPTGLIDVRRGLDAAQGDIDAAFDQIIAFLDASVPVIQQADPTRPKGLSDVLADFRRFTSS